jgi:hypothetical protein
MILFLQKKVKHDVAFRHIQLDSPRRQEELQLCLQEHFLSVINKICDLLEYQGVLIFVDALSFLQRMTKSFVHD